MATASKISQLQIRVSAQEKVAIQRAARRAGMDMSTYVLDRVLSKPAAQFSECVAACCGPASSFALAELNTLLSRFTAGELLEAVAAAPSVKWTPFIAYYISSMVEYACQKHALPVPKWTGEIAALPDPYFGTSLQSLRLHLLTQSPPPFRRRNIFIDASLGDRV